jgi:hypothetical protein
VLGRKTFPRDEIDQARKAVATQLAALRAHDDPELGNVVLLALDRRFVHRVRPVSGKDTNPVTELELVAESLVEHEGVFTTNKAITYVVDRSVLGLRDGDRIAPDADAVERLAHAYLAELEVRFLETPSEPPPTPPAPDRRGRR